MCNYRWTFLGENHGSRRIIKTRLPCLSWNSQGFYWRRDEKRKTLKEVRGDEAEFQRKVLKIKINVEKEAPKDKTVFFDRAIPDSIAYYQICGLDLKEVLKFCQKNVYQKIFFLEQLPFDQDYARIEDNQTIKKLNKFLKESYKNLGYEVIDIPVIPVEERVRKILKEINHEL